MAPSKCTIAFLLVLAAVAAILRPSSAARVQLQAEEAAPQPPSSGSAAPAPPSPQPAECSTSLSGLAPCADFLTANATNFLAAPAAACCDGVRSLVKDAPVCLCHVMSGDLGEILPAPELRLRAVALPRACGVAVPFGTLRQCIRGPVPPMDAPAPPS
ncbi:pEARLI1-like lipid transfer protein 2 [Panicum miliaceum]|uniref:PEARLI1-like lipid transfer protein 2 n=1 Tax=Panicum miliaceum TaxID=4540 RepID=A0A3L6TA62_PANMI|nr:pEARLI1-like lipid transfer protein 2 [Panicum miliaceum]